MVLTAGIQCLVHVPCMNTRLVIKQEYDLRASWIGLSFKDSVGNWFAQWLCERKYLEIIMNVWICMIHIFGIAHNHQKYN